MTLRQKQVKNKKYYYLDLSYAVLGKTKTFSKYIGSKKPNQKELNTINNKFKDEIIIKLSKKLYSQKYISKDEVIKSLLFREAFLKKYNFLTTVGKKKYDIESIDYFTLTTLTTEEIEVNIKDIINARNKKSALTQREQISKNMINAIESIKKSLPLTRINFLGLHKTIMNTFKEKRPGLIRNKNVHLYTNSEKESLGRELIYAPPHYNQVSDLLNEFLEWFEKNDLNPIEKSAISHYKLYKLHPFLDGNKRMCRLILNKNLFSEQFPLLNISKNKTEYFDAIIKSVEQNKPQILVDFTLKTYYLQIKEFLKK